MSEAAGERCAHERAYQHFTTEGEVWCDYCHAVLWRGVAAHAAIEEGDIGQQNIGAAITADLLREIAETGKHAGTFGGEQVEAAAQAILRLHAAPGGRERELREALRNAFVIAGEIADARQRTELRAHGFSAGDHAARLLSEWANKYRTLLDAAPAQTQDSTAGLAALAREMRGFTEQVWEAYANGVAVDFYDQARDLTERYDALVAQAETP